MRGARWRGWAQSLDEELLVDALDDAESELLEDSEEGAVVAEVEARLSVL